MSERSKTISKLRSDFDSRTSYIKAKLGVLVPSKIKALRLKSNMPRQRDLAIAAKMQQSRISMFETPGAANVTLETLAKLGAAFKVGLIVDFVPFSEMLRWENRYSQDAFDVTRIDEDAEFIGSDSGPILADITSVRVASWNLNSNVSATTTTVKMADVGTTNGAELVRAAPMRASEAGKMPQHQMAGGA
jgi:transcriptional regulator with XRE-family HTH domain